MKTGLTELVFILDKSGSMSGLEKDTIGGYNAMLEKQKSVNGECRITTVLFDNDCELLHDRIDIRAVAPITEKEYRVGGSTALIDAIGRIISKIGNAQRRTADDYRAEKVMFVIITDGEENSSREYSSDKVKSQIRRQKEKYGWEFIFLGANIDAVETAARFGIAPDRAQNYHADSKGTELNFRVMSEAVASFRACSSMPEGWNDEIQKDYKRRGSNSMSKYTPLWKAVNGHDGDGFSLSFAEIEQILGFPIDHSFLNFKKELTAYGWQVGKISLKAQTVAFLRTAG